MLRLCRPFSSQSSAALVRPFKILGVQQVAVGGLVKGYFSACPAPDDVRLRETRVPTESFKR